jgi:hypothetical protein
MARYIDADKLIMSFEPYFNGKKTIGQIIDNAPTEDVRPVVRGKWIEKKAIDGQRYHQCSACGKNKMDLTYDDFCKFCGADMRG